MKNINDKIINHYSKEELFNKILEVLKTSGVSTRNISQDDLNYLDEFHIGGIQVTKKILEDLKITSSTKVLDLGSGIGGPARYISSSYGAKVIGIELTPEFVDTAKQLNNLTGLNVDFFEGSAIEIPYKNKQFDIITLFHVGMNIQNKIKLFSEAFRLLVSGGFFVVYDVMRVGKGNIDFPVPWATEKDFSFVESPEYYKEKGINQGFIKYKERNYANFTLKLFEEANSNIKKSKKNVISASTLMGESFNIKIGNIIKAIEKECIAPVEIIFKKPAISKAKIS